MSTDDDADDAGGVPGERRDAELVAALMNGDQLLFADLVDQWSPAMLRVARVHVPNREAAEDVVQEAWMAALRGLPSFEGRSSLRTWVIGIVFNLARRHGSREQRNFADPSLTMQPTVDPGRFQEAGDKYPGGWKQFPSPWPSPEESAMRQEMLAQIYLALDKLPERQRAVIELRDVHGFNGQEVADILELSPGNERILLHRARASVRRELESYFTGTPG
jgi:RNA polymerase sigma-70 factor (ECF subfamily)